MWGIMCFQFGKTRKGNHRHLSILEEPKADEIRSQTKTAVNGHPGVSDVSEHVKQEIDAIFLDLSH